MTPEETKILGVLLDKMRTENESPSKDEPQGRPAGFVPEGCLNNFYKSTCTPFIELVIYRKVGLEFQYLYQNRDDKWWKGFCAFGGMVRAGFPRTPVGIAQKLLDREFKGLGITLKNLQIVSFLNWPEHPWCNPFATVCLIQVYEEIPEGEDRHWFSVNGLPRKKTIINHADYLVQCEYFLRHGALTFTKEYPRGVPIANF